MVEVETKELLQASGVCSEQRIGYGGVDEEGEIEVSSRRWGYSWDED